MLKPMDAQTLAAFLQKRMPHPKVHAHPLPQRTSQ